MTNGHYYSGEVLNETEFHITIQDKTGKEVKVLKSAIIIREELD